MIQGCKRVAVGLCEAIRRNVSEPLCEQPSEFIKLSAAQNNKLYFFFSGSPLSHFFENWDKSPQKKWDKGVNPGGLHKFSKFGKICGEHSHKKDKKMANIKGGRAARKRDRQNAKANKRNSVAKAKLHDAHKKLFKAADANNKEVAEKKFKEFVSGLDKAVKKGIITKNTADRKKSRAQLKLNKMAKAEEK